MKDERNFCITFCRHILAGMMMLVIVASVQAQTTAFTYQGKLADSGSPANGNYDFQFKLFDAVSGGTQQGATLTLNSVAVTNGIFTVTLDFGACTACFNGSARFLEIAVKPTGGGTFTTLSPRQTITSTPYAQKTLNLTFNGSHNDGVLIYTASNTFAGDGAGVSTTPSGLTDIPGKFNAFYGAGAGHDHTAGSFNTFIGARSGTSTTLAFRNTFIGAGAGYTNTVGSDNTFVGYSTSSAGDFNSRGNTLLGAYTQTGGLYSTAIGAYAQATQAYSLILGSINGVNGCDPANNLCDTVKVGIGTTAPAERLHVVGNGLFTGNVGIGTTAPIARLQVHTSTPDQHLYLSDTAPSLALGNNTVRSSATMNGLFALSTAASHFGVEAGSVTIAAYGNSRGNIYINSNYSGTGSTNVILQPLGGNVGVGVNPPADRLHIFGDARVGTSGTNGCLKNNNGGTIIGTCSSDSRFKRNVVPLAGLLDRVARLQPVTFYWRSEQFPDRHFGQAQEAGLIAQEVEKVLPELVSEDGQGYKAVNYSKLPLLTLQAVKELKAENDTLQQKLAEQQSLNFFQQQQLQNQQQEIQAIKQLLCQSNPQADLCKVKSVK